MEDWEKTYKPITNHLDKYASFQNEATAIGLELCQLLHNFCAKRKLDDF